MKENGEQVQNVTSQGEEANLQFDLTLEDLFGNDETSETCAEIQEPSVVEENERLSGTTMKGNEEQVQNATSQGEEANLQFDLTLEDLFGNDETSKTCAEIQEPSVVEENESARMEITDEMETHLEIQEIDIVNMVLRKVESLEKSSEIILTDLFKHHTVKIVCFLTEVCEIRYCNGNSFCETVRKRMDTFNFGDALSTALWELVDVLKSIKENATERNGIAVEMMEKGIPPTNREPFKMETVRTREIKQIRKAEHSHAVGNSLDQQKKEFQETVCKKVTKHYRGEPSEKVDSRPSFLRALKGQWEMNYKQKVNCDLLAKETCARVNFSNSTTMCDKDTVSDIVILDGAESSLSGKQKTQTSGACQAIKPSSSTADVYHNLKFVKIRKRGTTDQNKVPNTVKRVRFDDNENTVWAVPEKPQSCQEGIIMRFSEYRLRYPPLSGLMPEDYIETRSRPARKHSYNFFIGPGLAVKPVTIETFMESCSFERERGRFQAKRNVRNWLIVDSRFSRLNEDIFCLKRESSPQTHITRVAFPSISLRLFCETILEKKFASVSGLKVFFAVKDFIEDQLYSPQVFTTFIEHFALSLYDQFVNEFKMDSSMKDTKPADSASSSFQYSDIPQIYLINVPFGNNDRLANEYDAFNIAIANLAVKLERAFHHKESKQYLGIEVIDWRAVCMEKDMKINTEMVELLMRKLMVDYGVIAKPRHLTC